MKLLVVDDDPELREASFNYFSSQGWQVETASTEAKAKHMLSLRRDEKGNVVSPDYDAVLIDRDLNEVGTQAEGDNLIRWIRAQPYLAYTCVVMATGKPQLNSAIDALKLGAFHYLQLPLKPQERENVLRAGVAWHRAHKMRRELLKTLDGARVLWQIVGILRETLGKGCVHPILCKPDGVMHRLTSDERSIDDSQRRFVKRIKEKAVPVIAEGPEKMDGETIDDLDPICGGSKFLIAVPIMGANNQVRGILEVEGEEQNEFSRSWVDVLSYMADLIGLGQEIAEEAERLREVYRDLRHNIATHVQIVATQARLMQRLIESDPKATGESLRHHVRFIVDNAGDIEREVQDIKAIVEPVPNPAIEPVNLLELLQKCVDEQKPRLEEQHIQIKIQPAAGSVLVRTDPHWIAYSLRCLLNNAVESIQDKHYQTVGDKTTPDESITLVVEDEGAFVGIKISDSGIGFDNETARRLFLPLFSTKAKRWSSGKSQESTGLDRVERLLELMRWWCRRDPRSEAIPKEWGPGMELFIRDGNTVEMYIGHSKQGGLNLAHLQDKGFCHVGMDSPLAAEWLGRGEGLFSVRKRVARLGGVISPFSEGVGKGATFTITLPRFS